MSIIEDGHYVKLMVLSCTTNYTSRRMEMSNVIRLVQIYGDWYGRQRFNPEIGNFIWRWVLVKLVAFEDDQVLLFVLEMKILVDGAVNRAEKTISGGAVFYGLSGTFWLLLSYMFAGVQRLCWLRGWGFESYRIVLVQWRLVILMLSGL
ncbi:hypothetical protein F0562_011395 [Nyssa sinensis]|uniref:Uncharacterized protein n=1 Tax=Nyssa sinensis TaxID=561372 RepID=A0A5J5A6J6_9ASTE|nr:hypothetical protein F0562_011395 [Nyssa sinensis]